MKKSVEDIDIGNYILYRTLITQKIRMIIDKWDCIKLNVSAHQRNQLPESRNNPQNGKKSLPGTQQTRDSYPGYPMSSKH
jgi:hypothetical protein